MKLTLNLASRYYLNRRSINILYGMLILSLLVLLAFNGYAAFQGMQREGWLKDRLAMMREESESLAPSGKVISEAKLNAQAERIRMANELLLQDSFAWTKVLGRLEELLPRGVTLRVFSPNYSQGELRLLGHAEDLEGLRVFLDRLLESSFFEDVFLQSHSRVDESSVASEGGGGIRFSLVTKGVF